MSSEYCIDMISLDGGILEQWKYFTNPPDEENESENPATAAKGRKSVDLLNHPGIHQLEIIYARQCFEVV